MVKKFVCYLTWLIINNIFPLFASDLMEQHENHHQGTYPDWASSIINQYYPYDKVVLSQTNPIIIEDYDRLARECFNKKDFAGASDYYKMFYLLKGNNISFEDIFNIAASLYNNNEFSQSALFYDLYLLRSNKTCSPVIYEYAGDAHFKGKDYDMAYKLYITANCYEKADAVRLWTSISGNKIGFCP